MPYTAVGDFKKGFTLVELAIVMTIIGLLIGGILKGQELLENARVTSTIAQVKSYEAAVTSFRDVYDGLPGDLRNAGDRIPGCNANCTPFADDAGDGVVFVKSWRNDEGWDTPSDTGLTLPPAGRVDETYLFWLHLLKANFISGISDQGLTTATPSQWGVTEPAAKIGGGFIAGHNDGSPTYLAPDVAGPNGLLVGLIGANKNGNGIHIEDGNGALIPMRAAQIDRKMDDGQPASGQVMAVGSDSGAAMPCVLSEGSGQYSYNETISSRECNLLIVIQQ